MHDRIILSLALIVMSCAVWSSAGATEVISASPSQTVRGQIVKVEGQTYVVQDVTGKEIKVHVDGNTMMMDGTTLHEGDTITADVTAKGQASYIIPGPAPSDRTKGASAGSPSPEMESGGRRP